MTEQTKSNYHTTYRGAHVFMHFNTNGVNKNTYSAHCCGFALASHCLDDLKRKIDVLVPDTKPTAKGHVYTFPILPKRPVVTA